MPHTQSRHYAHISRSLNGKSDCKQCVKHEVNRLYFVQGIKKKTVVDLVAGGIIISLEKGPSFTNCGRAPTIVNTFIF